MAVIPADSSESESTVLADCLSQALHEQLPSSQLVYPFRWLFGTMRQDSLNSLHYLTEYAKKIKLDRIYRVHRIRNDQFLITRHSILSPILTDTLIVPKQSSEIMNIPLSFWSLESDASNQQEMISVHLPVRSSAYHQILRAQWNGDYLNAARIASSVPDDDDLAIRIKQFETLLDEALARQKDFLSGQAQYVGCYSLLESMNQRERSLAYVQYLQGRLALQEKHWNQAGIFLKNALNQDPGLAEAYLLLSKLDASRLNQTSCRTSFGCLKHAFYYNPASAECRLALAEACIRRGRVKQAEQIYQTLIDFRPDRSDYYFSLGNFYLSRGDFIQMISVYERLIRMHPDNSEALYNLGIAYYNQQDPGNADRFFRKAVAIDNHADSHFYLAKINLDRKDWAEAAHQFQERVALRKGPLDPYADEARKQLALLRAEIIRMDS